MQPLTVSELANRFGFDLDELALNRQGELSAQQRQTVRYRSWGYLARGCVMLVIGAGITIYLAPTANSPPYQLLLAAIALLLGTSAAILLMDAYHALRPTAHSVSGRLRRGDNPRCPAVMVGGFALRVNSRRWRHLDKDFPGCYRAYSDPAGYLLSIEPEP